MHKVTVEGADKTLSVKEICLSQKYMYTGIKKYQSQRYGDDVSLLSSIWIF